MHVVDKARLHARISLLERASTLLGGNCPIWRGGLEGVASETEKEHSEHSRQRHEFGTASLCLCGETRLIVC